LLARYDQEQLQQIQIINAVPELLTHALNIGPEEISGVNAGLLDRLMGRRDITVTTPHGTELHATLDSDRSVWISSRGMATHVGDVIILPAGEVATLPLTMSGVFVVDGAFSVNAHVQRDTRLHESPVRLTIEDNKVVDMQCADNDLATLLGRLMSLPHGREVGELGFGTNIGTRGFVAINSFINERHPGVHVGLGQHNQGGFLDPLDTPLHMDFIAPGARIYIDGDDRGPIDCQQLQPSSCAHPGRARVLEEDVETDCCGLRRGVDSRYIPRLDDLVARTASTELL